jgi:F-type H+-transporting ATPase subunit alpha
VTNGLADDIEVADLKRFEDGLFKFVEGSHPAVLETIRTKKSIDDDLKSSMRQAIDDFKSTRWSEARTAVAAGA